MYAEGLITAVNLLHSCGFIYRDIKPGNTLLNNKSKVYLCDSESVKFLEYPRVKDKNLGTPGSIAPEVLEEGIYTKESDIYSVGKTLESLIERNKVGDLKRAIRVGEERSFGAYFSK